MKQLVILEVNPKEGAQMSESLKQQGHAMAKAFIREDGVADTAPAIYHCTPEMLETADKTAIEPKKAPAKKAAPAKTTSKKK